MKDQPQTDTESVSPEVEALARELWAIGMKGFRGDKYSIAGIWAGMMPDQKRGWYAIAEYVRSVYA